MTAQQAYDIITRDAVAVFSADSLREKLLGGKTLTVKYGVDPTRPDIHLGHLVPIKKLKLLQDLGHRIVFLIGDFTAMIGDPSGKNKTRVPLTFEQTRENAKSYCEQIVKILDKDKIKIIYNSEWLSDMKFADVLSLAGKYTVARIMERDDFSKRFRENQPIGLHEIFYPLMQGYDSVALEADIEIGGTDQTFNMLVGRELQKDYSQASQEVITFPLLPGLDGVEKMSKSLDNYIGIDEPPEIMYEKCMKVPDQLIYEYFNLTTGLEESSYSELIKTDVRAAHFLYADTIVTEFHGKSAADSAAKRYGSVAGGGVPEDITVFEASAGQTVTEILAASSLAPSKSEARRLIQGGGIKLDGSVLTDFTKTLDSGEYIISKGKNKFIKAIIK